MSVFRSAVLYLRAQAAYQQTFRDYFQSQLLPLPAGRYWELVDRLVNLLAGIPGQDRAACAVEAFFRETVRDPAQRAPRDFSGAPDLDEAIRFARHWQDQQQALWAALRALAGAPGPERCERLADSLPLAGRRLSETLSGRPWTHFQEFSQTLQDACAPRPWLAPLIDPSRCSWAGALRETAQAYFAARALQEAEEIAWFDEIW